MNFGLLLTSTINDKNFNEAKQKFFMKIDKYKETKEKEKDEMNKKIIFYNNNFQKKREQNDEIYFNYLQTFTKLKENWLLSNKENDMEKLKNLKRPDLINVDDIYTYMIVRNKKFKN